MARRTSEPRTDKTLDAADEIRENHGDLDLPERYTQDGIMERREHVQKFLARRVPQTVMAELLGVSRRTIYEDVQWLKRQQQQHVEQVKQDPEAASADIGLASMRLEGISQAALNDYELARTDQSKNNFLNTAIKAEKTRADMLMQTGVWPKAGEDIRVHNTLDATFTAKIGAVSDDSPLKILDHADSRRKVLSAAETILKKGVEKQKRLQEERQAKSLKNQSETVIDVSAKSKDAST